jgi:hypothetical protein
MGTVMGTMVDVEALESCLVRGWDCVCECEEDEVRAYCSMSSVRELICVMGRWTGTEWRRRRRERDGRWNGNGSVTLMPNARSVHVASGKS